MRMESTGNLFSYEGWGITSGEVDSVGVEVIIVAADSLPPDGQEEKDGTLGG